RIIEPLAGTFSPPHNIPPDKSPNQSPNLVMTPHPKFLYLVVIEKNKCNYVKIHPHEENARGAE
ncbi:MAG: hypothetical protein JSV68_00240, partial [Anaerolineaceae bacterium]